jgi:hypothetical protein
MSSNSFVQRLIRDEAGGPLVEATVLIPIMFTFLFGAIDFCFLFYQWNAAAKAVEVGARIAAVSNPVASGLNNISQNVVNPGVVDPGDPMPAFTITCDGSAGSCTCSGAACAGTAITYDLTAMRTIVFGRAGLTSCGTPSSYYFAGMCNMFERITPGNVQVVYTQTGLGYAGRPDGPQPTVTVSLLQTAGAALQFQYFFLGGLLGFANINIPAFPTTITGEVLSSTAQPPP